MASVKAEAAGRSSAPPTIWREHDKAILDEQALALLVVIMTAGLLLRCLLLDTHMYLDEAMSGIAGREVLSRGFPFFPSDLFYDRDPLYHYLLAGSFLLGGDSLLSGRLLGVIPSVLAIGAIYALGRQMFGSRLIGLLAALLLAIDPFSISLAARMRMYGLLQLTTIVAVLLFERQFVGEARARSRWKWGTALAMGTGVLSHQLFLLIGPPVLLVFLRYVRGSRFEWRTVVAFALVGSVVLAAPVLLERAAMDTAGTVGKVSWFGGVNTSLAGQHYAAAPLSEVYAAKLEVAGPSRASSVARFAGALLAISAALLLLSRASGRLRPAVRLFLYGGGALALLFAFPDYQMPSRWGVHFAPFLLLLLAAAAWPGERTDDLARQPVRWLVAVAALAMVASAAVIDPAGALWRLRYPLMALVTLVGVAHWALRWRAGERDATAARPALVGGLSAMLLAIAMPLGLWWTDVAPWDDAGAAIARAMRPDDRVVVHGDDAPTVYWATGRVSAVIPTWRMEFGVDASGRRFDLFSGAPLLEDPADAARILGDGRVFWVHGAVFTPTGSDGVYFERVGRPLVQWAEERLSAWRSIGPLDVEVGAPGRTLARGVP